MSADDIRKAREKERARQAYQAQFGNPNTAQPPAKRPALQSPAGGPASGRALGGAQGAGGSDLSDLPPEALEKLKMHKEQK